MPSIKENINIENLCLLVASVHYTFDLCDLLFSICHFREGV